MAAQQPWRPSAGPRQASWIGGKPQVGMPQQPANRPAFLPGYEVQMQMGRGGRNYAPRGGAQNTSTATGSGFAPQSSGGSGRGSSTIMSPRRGPVQYKGGAAPAGTFVPESAAGQGMGSLSNYYQQGPSQNKLLQWQKQIDQNIMGQNQMFQNNMDSLLGGNMGATPLAAPAATPFGASRIEDAFNPDGSKRDSLIFGNPDLFKAKGGPVEKVQPYIVGEEGPELFIPKVDGKIMPHKKTMEMLRPQFRRTGGPVQGNAMGMGDDSGFNGNIGYQGNRYISPNVFQQVFSGGGFAPRGIGADRGMGLNPSSGPVEIGADEIYERYPWAPRNRAGLGQFVDLARQQAAYSQAKNAAGRQAVQDVRTAQIAEEAENRRLDPSADWSGQGNGRAQITSRYGTASVAPSTGRPGLFEADQVTLAALRPTVPAQAVQSLVNTDKKSAALFNEWRKAEALPNPMSRLKKKK